MSEEDPDVARLIEETKRRRAELQRDPHAWPADMAWGMVAFRGLFLLVAVGMMVFVPVTVYRCGPDGEGTVGCQIEERAQLGLRLLETEQVRGVAGASSAPDRWSMRLVDREGAVVAEKTQSAVVGTSMATVARRIGATANGSSPWTAWQWPLPIAAFAGASLVFVASGPIGWLFRRRRAMQEKAEATGKARGADLLDAAIPLGMWGLAAAVFWMAPVVRYRCVSGAGGTSCRIEWRAAGLMTLDAVDVAGVASATSTSRTVHHREQRDGQWHDSTETVTTLSLLGAGSRVLFEDQQSGLVGTSGAALAAEIDRLARAGGNASLTRSHAPGIGLGFGVLLMVLSILPLLSLVGKLRRG